MLMSVPRAAWHPAAADTAPTAGVGFAEFWLLLPTAMLGCLQPARGT